MILTPEYKLKSIGSVNALARLLQLPLSRVQYLANNASDFYRVAKIEQKKSGGQRITYDAYKSLKSIHRKLQIQIFKKVVYSQYIQGSISGRSYITNVRHHINALLWFSGVLMLSLIDVVDIKYLNNIVEQSHRSIKQKMVLALGWKSETGALATMAGQETWTMIKRGQIIGNDSLPVWERFYALAA